MPAYWLTYKPLSAASPRGWPAEKLRKLVRRFEGDPTNVTALWRFASHQSGRVGDRIYLFKQGSGPRGVFGTGEIVEAPLLQSDPTDIDQGPRYRAKIRFDRLVNPGQEFLIEFETIAEMLPATLVTTRSSGISVPDDVAVELEKRLPPRLPLLPTIGSELADDPSFDPDSVEDERERAIRAIRVRRGQPAFRAALLEAYGRRCAITGCAVADVLEAAHITPYLGRLTHHVSNGLLLRTDLHTLFDCGLLAIEPVTRTVVIAEALKISSYSKLAGTRLRQPEEAARAPSKRNLEKRYREFGARHSL
ncbi:MAG: HNH endonuclease [Mesorhizobium sp.]|nr:HNH endonuclease [Mesorhizobium sp.]